MAEEVVKRFTDRINKHDVKGLVELMSPDHVFIDSLGNRFGRPEIEEGWTEYFRMVPDYSIRIDRIVSDPGDGFVLLGVASGTFVPKHGRMDKENYWETPAAWSVQVRSGRVSEWRVYSDNEPIREKMRLSSRP